MQTNISFDRRQNVDNGPLSFIQAMTFIRGSCGDTTLDSGAMLGPVTFRNQRLYAVARGGVTPGGAPYNWQRTTPFTFAHGGIRYVYIQNPNHGIYDSPWGLWWEERVTINYSPTTGIVRFHFDGIIVGIPVTLGQRIPHHLIPIPQTRYGFLRTPGHHFMGWFTQQNPIHNVDSPNRTTPFDLNQTLTAAHFTNGVLNLHGSWLQYGDVNGDGAINMGDLIMLQRFLLRAITETQIVIEVADVNVDGAINMADLILLQRFLLREQVIIGLRP